jgi:hypothetical protein
MSSAAGSLAKTFPLPDEQPDSTESTPDSGTSSLESSERLEHLGSSLRTHLASALSALTGCSLTWKNARTPGGRSWWVLSMPARHKSGSGHSLLPTPRATDADRGGRVDLLQVLRGYKTTHTAMILPTCTASNYGNNRGGAAGRVGPKRWSLRSQIPGKTDLLTVSRWMMGYPKMWTLLSKPMEMLCCPSSPSSSGEQS